LKPVKVEGLAFMFESKMMMDTPTRAIEEREVDYQQCWQGLKKRFNGELNPWK
jgi:homogentisate 1,2-dioxygenase